MINKLSNVNLVNFAGKSNNEKKYSVNPQEKPQQSVIVSKEGAKALRNLTLGLAILGSSGAMLSCEGDDDKFTSSTEVENIIFFRPCPLKPDTVYVPVPGKNDTIMVVLPPDTITMKDKYKSEVADSLVAHGKNLGFEFAGEGKVPVRINAFDQLNSTNHDLVLDGKASSEEQMIFIDEAKDYSKDSKNPTVRYNRIEFSVDKSRGIGASILKAPYVGVKPASVMEWRDAAKICSTNMKDGTNIISKYDNNNGLSQIGTLEKSNEKDVDFYENLFVEPDGLDIYSWSETKMTLANPEK